MNPPLESVLSGWVTFHFTRTALYGINQVSGKWCFGEIGLVEKRNMPSWR